MQRKAPDIFDPRIALRLSRPRVLDSKIEPERMFCRWFLMAVALYLYSVFRTGTETCLPSDCPPK